MIRGKSFKHQDTPRLVDTEYRECNFLMRQPLEVNGKKVGVRLFPGDDTPRTFINCNLSNRIVPPGSTVIDCKMSIVEMKLIDSTDEIIIDGETITKTYYKNIVHGAYNNASVAEYRDTPETINLGGRDD